MYIIYHPKIFLMVKIHSEIYIKTSVDRLPFLYYRYLNKDDFHIGILMQIVLGHKQREGHYEQIITRHTIKL